MPAGSLLNPITHDGNAFQVSGRVERPQLFQQRRTITYSPARFLIVRDHVVSERDWTFVSSLHLAPDLVAQVTATGFEVDLGSGNRVGAEFLPQATITGVRGQARPPLGWYASGYGQMEPATTVRAECGGRDCTMTWVIWFGDQWRADALELAGGGKPTVLPG
jgi:hypothetical protein